MRYLVNDIYPCIQGEGVNTGVPMILVRLHGCPVECVFCDTRETWTIDPNDEVEALKNALGTSPRYARVSPETIVEQIDELNPSRGIRDILLTGGEPATQDLNELVRVLHARGYWVNLETSGTALGHVEAEVDWVCISPKMNNPGGLPVLPDAVSMADEMTWVIGRESDIEEMLSFVTEYPLPDECNICVQPMSQSRHATEVCMEASERYGFRLSIQVHKYLSIR